MLFGNDSYTNDKLKPFDPSLTMSDTATMLHQEAVGSFINEFTTPVSSIYMDIRYLRDYVLGALVALSPTDEIPHIKKQLDKYNSRIRDIPIDDIFEGISIKQSDIDIFLKDPDNTDALLLKTPTTEMYAQLHEFCGLILQNNKRIESPCVIKLCINFYPFTPSDLVKSFYSKLFENIAPNLKLQVMNHKLSTLPADVLLMGNNKTPRFQMMYIYDYADFISIDSNYSRSYLEYLLFHKVAIFGPKHIGPDIPLDNRLRDIENGFKQAHAVFNICSTFNYLTPIISSQ